VAEHTTISLKKDTRDKLFRLKEYPSETYNSVILDLLEEKDE